MSGGTTSRSTAALSLTARLFRRLNELLTPRQCPWCNGPLGRDGDALGCAKCRARIQPIRPPLCRVCGLPFAAGDGGALCADCAKKRPAYDMLRGTVTYAGAAAKTIKELKYYRYTGSLHALARVLRAVEELGVRWDDYDALVPVPLHPKRLAERHFNQARLLARHLGPGVPPVQTAWLERARPTPPQAQLTDKERHKNVKHAFVVPAGADVAGRAILLIDDVASTGATLHECAKILKRAGAVRVDAAVVARAVR
ncbi:MAG TPA: ComF family protein [bacterium]|nr:ComF family protein [bacterium]